MTNDRVILDLVKGYKIQFMEEPYQKKVPQEPKFQKEEEEIISKEVQDMLEKGAITQVIPEVDQFLSQIFVVDKKGGGHQLKEPKQFHPLLTFQNGESLISQGPVTARGLPSETISEGSLFCGTTAQGLPKVCNISMEKEGLPVIMPVLWSGASSTIVHKTNEGAYCHNEMAKLQIDNIPRRYFNLWENPWGSFRGSGYFDFPTSKFWFSYQCKEISVHSLPSIRVFRDDNRFIRNENVPSSRKTDQNNRPMQINTRQKYCISARSIKTDREALLYSPSSSSCSTLSQSTSSSTNSNIVSSSLLQGHSDSFRRSQRGIVAK